MRDWMRSGRVFINPLPVSAGTKIEMQRGAERTGQPDPFGAGVTTVSIGREEIEEPTDEFPTDLMVARVSLALEAGVDREFTYNDERDQWEKRRG